MNTFTRLVGALALGSILQVAVAHDPAEHAKEVQDKAAGPDCAAMQDMDHSKMDMEDPIMQAMMSQCEGHMDHDQMEHMDGMSGMDHRSTSDASSEPPASHDHGSH